MTHSFPTRRASDLAPAAQREIGHAESGGDERVLGFGRADEADGEGKDGRRARRTLAQQIDEPVERRRRVADGHHRARQRVAPEVRSEEHTSELQSLMRISYAVFCLKKKKNN